MSRCTRGLHKHGLHLGLQRQRFLSNAYCSYRLSAQSLTDPPPSADRVQSRVHVEEPGQQNSGDRHALVASDVGLLAFPFDGILSTACPATLPKGRSEGLFLEQVGHLFSQSPSCMPQSWTIRSKENSLDRSYVATSRACPHALPFRICACNPGLSELPIGPQILPIS